RWSGSWSASCSLSGVRPSCFPLRSRPLPSFLSSASSEMAKCGASAGRVLETTPGPRSTYFGAVLTGREALMFNATEDMSQACREEARERILALPKDHPERRVYRGANLLDARDRVAKLRERIGSSG